MLILENTSNLLQKVNFYQTAHFSCFILEALKACPFNVSLYLQHLTLHRSVRNIHVSHPRKRVIWKDKRFENYSIWYLTVDIMIDSKTSWMEKLQPTSEVFYIEILCNGWTTKTEYLYFFITPAATSLHWVGYGRMEMKRAVMRWTNAFSMWLIGLSPSIICSVKKGSNGAFLPYECDAIMLYCCVKSTFATIETMNP